MAEEKKLVSNDMQLGEGEILKIKVVKSNSSGQCRVQTNVNGRKSHIIEALTKICDGYDLICIPKQAIQSGLIKVTYLNSTDCEESNNTEAS